MNIAVVFGSRSVEHDVSITSAYGVMMGLKKNTGHHVFPIYITRNGKWIYDPKFLDINSFRDFKEDNYKNTRFEIDFSKSGKLCFTQDTWALFSKSTSENIDFVFPILHGMNGEDGSIQGIFDILQVPYMWPSIAASAVWMNKIIMKDVFQSHGIKITPYLVFQKNTFDSKIVEKEIGYPLIVKPANLGSSIGISKVEKSEDLENAVEIGFHYDHDIIIEMCVQNLIELNCSVSEFDGEIVTSLVEQPIGSSDFLSFEEKYVSTEWGTMQGLKNRVNIPAQIPDSLRDIIQQNCKAIYKYLFCKWWAPRIDFLYDKISWELYVNEINTIPWALQMHLWDKSWYPVGIFLQKLIETGIEKQKERKLNIDFQSNIIGHTIAFTK